MTYTNDEIIEILTSRHFKRLEKKLLELHLPQLVYIAVSKQFRYLENDLKKAFSYNDEDLHFFLTGEK